MKNKTQKIYIQVVVALAALSGAACSNSGLDGSAAQYTASDAAKSTQTDPKKDIKAGRTLENDPGKNVGDSGQPAAEDPSDSLIKSTSDPAVDALLACLLKKSLNYNVVIVLDNSGSQKKSDPTRVRRDVSKNFVKRMNNLVYNKSDTIVKIATVGFSAKVTNSPSWVQLDGADTATAGEPVDQLFASIDAETSNETAGTNYGPAFQAAGSLLSSMGPDRLESTTRNYVLFMTDGEPTDNYSIASLRETIVTNNKAAIISIASGQSISAKGESIVRARALPETGDPKGAYYRAATPEAVKDAWDKIFVDLGGCK